MTKPPADTVGAFVGEPAVLASGAPGGPLAGTTLGVKDLFDVAGTVTGAGNPEFAAAREPAVVHAEAVVRLVEAGATVVGKTITDELAFSLSGTNVHYGAPVNPAAVDCVAGGSSAGSAAAVAAGLVDLALGTDTGGSVRLPASYCGIVGWRPTHGAVSTRGVVALAPSFDTVGLLARDIALLEQAAGVLLVPPRSRDPDHREVGSVRLLAESLAEVCEDVAAATRSGAATAGIGGPELSLGVNLDRALAAFRDRQGFEAWAEHGRWIETHRPAMGPGIAERFRAAGTVTRAAVDAADAVCAEVRAAVMAATDRGTVLVSPAAAGPAPVLGGEPGAYAGVRLQTLRLTCLAGLAGAPVVVLPLSRVDDRPVGLACMGAPGSDRALLAWAREVLS